MQKHEWRKKEKVFYQPKTKPALIEVPEFRFVTISGKGNPNSAGFGEYISALYSVSYAIKMGLKKAETQPEGYIDYTVYPLEGFWSITEEAQQRPDGQFTKDDFVFKIMVRQPDFIDEAIFQEKLAITKQKKPHNLLEQVQFERITEGTCVQMMHIGSYDDEPASFAQMEAFTAEQGLSRLSKEHHEIYISDFRKVAPEKLKTVLRFGVE